MCSNMGSTFRNNSGLNHKALIQILRKCVERSGICSAIYSENAKIFYKAHRQLDLLWKIMNNEENGKRNGIL